MDPRGSGLFRRDAGADWAADTRACAARVLAGESLASVCRDLADRGITGTGGRGWKATTLRTMLMSARISGRREHKPRAAGGHKRPGPGEIVATAVWPAIISPADSDRLRALLGDAQRRTRLPGTGRTYLLSGILRCGRCGGGLVGRPKSGTPRYVCPNTPGGSTCGKIATVAEPTDTLVRDLVLTALDSPEMLARLHAQQDDSGGLDEQVRADEQRQDDLAAAWASGEISRREWMTARTVIEQRLEAARARLARVDQPDDAPDIRRHRSRHDRAVGPAERLTASCHPRSRAAVSHGAPGRPTQEVGSDPVRAGVDCLRSSSCDASDPTGGGMTDRRCWSEERKREGFEPRTVARLSLSRSGTSGGRCGCSRWWTCAAAGGPSRGATCGVSRRERCRSGCRCRSMLRRSLGPTLEGTALPIPRSGRRRADTGR